MLPQHPAAESTACTTSGHAELGQQQHQHLTAATAVAAAVAAAGCVFIA